jgi:hypothetical protein
MKTRFVGLVVLLVVFTGISQAQLSQHALVKTVSVPVRLVKFFGSHSLQGLKDTAGAAVFAAEEGVDAVHFGFAAANLATSVGDGKYFGVVHLAFREADEYSAKVDSGFEAAERYLFGSSN